MYQDKVTLCGSNAYEKKYYLNPDFSGLPEQIKQELQIACVLFTAEVGGVLTLEFDEEGKLNFVTHVEDNDFFYDEIGSELMIKKLRQEKQDFWESLELYYKIFLLGEDEVKIMLLALDVGNTNITIGVFKRKEIIEVFRITTKLPRTSDEFGILISSLLKEKGLDEGEVKAAIIGSVVPNIMHSLSSGLIKYFDVKPIIVGPGIKTGINLGRFNPREVGADRIVDLVAGYEIYGGPALVIDYGTATTYDIVTENGVFLAGVIAPGIRTSANVLYRDAARLPEIEILKPKTILANSTIDSMQAGLYYGVVGETKYMVQKMKEESGFDNMKVIATGGLGNMIAQTVDEIDYYDPTLTLKGLQIIYEKQ